MVLEPSGSKLFVVTKWFLPGPERACSLASPEESYDCILKKDRSRIGSRLAERKDLYSTTPAEIRNASKVAKVLGDEVIVKKYSEFEVPRNLCVKDSNKFKIPEPLCTPKHVGVFKNCKEYSPDEYWTKDKNNLKTPESNKKSSKNKTSEQKKAPESFLRSLKRRSLRVARSKSWVCSEKRKSGE